MPSRPLTILFMPESAYGPTNNCIGIGDVLRRRGHRVVFAAEASWRGRLEPLGLRGGPRRPGAAARGRGGQDAGQFWKDFIRDTAPEFRKPTIEQLATFKPTWQALIDGAMYCQPQLREILDRRRPDVIVEDNVIAFPGADDRRRAVRADRVVQPARDPGPGRRRRSSPGTLPTADTGMGRVPRRVRPHAPPDVAHFNDWVQEQGAPPCPTSSSSTESTSTCTSSRAGRLHRRAPARRDLAPARLLASGHRRRLRGLADLAAGRRRRPDLPLARAHSGRPTST